MAEPIQTPQGVIVAPPGAHVLITGPISGTVTKADGTVVDVTGDLIVKDQDEADEISFLIGEHWVEHGHPHDVEVSGEDDASAPDGELVQRPFVHVHPKKFDKHPGKFKGTPAGVPFQPKSKKG